MSRPRVRAVVLSAGFGSRLRPITAGLPKPLLPVLGESLLHRHLALLARFGCEACVVNLHHLGDQIPPAIGDMVDGMAVHYSHEAEILGTLGGLVRVRDFLSEAEVALVVNGDSLCRWPLRSLLRHHQRRKARATLLLSTRAPVEVYGGVGVGSDLALTELPTTEASMRTQRRFVFAGCQALDPTVLQGWSEEPSDTIRDLYPDLLARREPVTCRLYRGRWYDLGTPGRLLQALTELAGGVLGLSNWVHAEARVAEGRHRRLVAERGTVVAADCRLEDVVLLPGSRVGEGSELARVVLEAGVDLPPGASVQDRLVAAVRPGQDLPEGSSVVGRFAYVPLDPIRSGRAEAS